MTKKHDFIYELFSGYKKEQIDYVLSELGTSEVKLVNEWCNEGDFRMNRVNKKVVKNHTFPKIRESLLKQYGQPIGNKSIYGLFNGYKKEQIDEVLSECKPKVVNLIYLWCSEDEIEKNLCLKDYVRVRRVRMDDNCKRRVELVYIPQIRESLAKKYGKPKESKSIYELFNDYPREQVDAVIATLSDNERELIMLKYRDDLANPVSLEMTEEQENIFSNSLLPRVKRLLEKANEEIDFMDFLKRTMLEGISMSLSDREQLIIALKFGYIDGKYYRNEDIAKILKLKESDIIETIQKVYDENVKKLIDHSIEISTEKRLIRKKERI